MINHATEHSPGWSKRLLLNQYGYCPGSKASAASAAVELIFMTRMQADITKMT